MSACTLSQEMTEYDSKAESTCGCLQDYCSLLSVAGMAARCLCLLLGLLGGLQAERLEGVLHAGASPRPMCS